MTKHTPKIWLTIGAVAGLAFLLWVGGAQGQRQPDAGPPTVITTEYLLVPPEEVGITLDILLQVDHELTAARLNEYAADGWRVKEFGPFGLPTIVLEREIVHAPGE